MRMTYIFRDMRISYIFLLISLKISICVGILSFVFTDFYFIEGFEKALDGVLLFSSISLGFYGACISIIASIFNTKVVKDIMSDKEDKREFIVVVSSTLIIGFLTVISTIVYQVFLANGQIPTMYLKIMNCCWSSLVIMFIFMNAIFIFVSFLVFFNNKEDQSLIEDKDVYTPQLKNK